MASTQPRSIRLRTLITILLVGVVVALVGLGLYRRSTAFRVTEYAAFRGHEGAICDFALSPDGKLLITTGHDKTIRIWDVDQRAQIGMVTLESAPALRLAMSPDVESFYSASTNGVVIQWDLRRHTVLRETRVGRSQISGLAVSPRDRLLATSSDDAVRTSRFEKETVTHTMEFPLEHRNSVLEFSRDGRVLIWGKDLLERGSVVWDVVTNKYQTSWGGGLKCAAFLGDSYEVAIGAGQHVVIRDGISGNHVAQLRHDSYEVHALACDSEAKTLAVGQSFGMITIWDLSSRTIIKTFAAYPEVVNVSKVAFSPDGTRLASHCNDIGFNDSPGYSRVKIWDLKNRR